MVIILQILRGFYRLLLRLYPREHRSEYGEELQTVFDLSLDEAAARGGFEIEKLMLRELLSLPKAILIERLRERGRVDMPNKFGSYFNFPHGSRREIFTALYPFLLFGAFFPLVNILGQSGIIPVPNSFLDWLSAILAGSMGLLLMSGLASGLPRWSFLYVGILLSLFSVYGFSDWLRKFFGIYDYPYYNISWFLGQLVYQGYLWIGLTVVAILLVMATVIFPKWKRFKRDWTLPCFLLFGAAPFAIFLTFDDYLHEELYETVIFLLQALVVWLYLRTSGNWRRFLILFGGFALSMWMAAVSKAILGLSQPWFRGSQIEWWGNEMMSTVIMWMWIAFSMLLPLALSLFTQDEDEVPATSEI